jgi:hypothetical protein
MARKAVGGGGGGEGERERETEQTRVALRVSGPFTECVYNSRLLRAHKSNNELFSRRAAFPAAADSLPAETSVDVD